ncbi:ABC transporter ATP-binding protein [Candidatus Parcubacteria bacterium]|nr:ABC transporter ATP-binding protein [Candidatus Parcubacteria bacterium]
MDQGELRKELLYLEGVEKRYGSKMVLNGIDLAVDRGEFCTVVGPSGCGKSTLLRLILGQERSSSGVMLIDECPVGLPDENRGIVFQRYSLYPHLTVFENVYLGRRLGLNLFERIRRRRELRDEAMYHLERVELVEHKDKYPHELSGGMQQRVAIAQALIVKPKILLMDEPFGALDPSTREHMQVFLLELWEQSGMTLFFVTHDLVEAVYLGTRILVLSPFYQDGEGGGTDHGSKIVADYPSPWGRRATGTAVKASAQFGEFIAEIRREGFDPTHLQRIEEFNLRSRNSFHVSTS